MNILEEQKRRKQLYDPLFKKDQEIEKEIKRLKKEQRKINKEMKIVNPDYFEIAIKAIEEEYGCRIIEYGFKTDTVRYFDLYAADSTPKQIQYRRPEKVIGHMEVYNGYLCAYHPYGPDIIIDYPETTAQLKWLMTHNYTYYMPKLWQKYQKTKYTLKELVDIMLEEERKKNDNGNRLHDGIR